MTRVSHIHGDSTSQQLHPPSLDETARRINSTRCNKFASVEEDWAGLYENVLKTYCKVYREVFYRDVLKDTQLWVHLR